MNTSSRNIKTPYNEQKHIKNLEKTYPAIVEKQPIGRRLFDDFCQTRVDLKNCVEFLKLVQNYELSLEAKKQIAQEIRETFLQPVRNGTAEGHKKPLTVRINNQQFSQ